MILGTDAAMHQRGVDWLAVAKEGVRFAFIKATEGQGYIDPSWARHAVETEEAGILRGAYHVLWPTRDPIVQARHFHEVAGHVAELPPVLDFELMKGASPEAVHDCAVRFVLETEQLWGRECIVYTYPSFWQGLGQRAAVSPLGSRPLWIAHYGARQPTVPLPWKSWRFWQFDGDGGRRFPGGIDADFNWFAGTEAELLAMAGRAPTDPAPPPETLRSETLADLSLSSPATPLRAGEGERTVKPEEIEP